MIPPEKQLAHYISIRLNSLEGIKTQREVARDLGYDKPNIISMFKHGEAKVPLGKIPALAESINGDPRHMWRLAMQQLDEPDIGMAVRRIFGGEPISENEAELVAVVRKVSDGLDPKLTDQQKLEIQEVIMGKIKAAEAGDDLPDVPGEAVGLQDMNFKVHPAFHRQFKMTAAAQGMSMKELLEASFQAWKEAQSGL